MLKTKFPKNPYNGMIFYSMDAKRTYEFLKDFDGIGNHKWYDITNEDLDPFTGLR